MSREFNFRILPDELKQIIGKRRIRPNMVGMSGHYVYHLIDKTGKPNQYLKIAHASHPEKLSREKDVLKWLSGKLAVPNVIYYKERDDYQYLLLSEIKGEGSHHNSFQSEITKVVNLFARGMNRIHKVRIDDCPFDRRLKVVVKEAEKRVKLGLVEEDEFLDEYIGMSAGQLFDMLISRSSSISDKENIVFTHGDYCLPNVIIDGERISGFIDWGRAGIADPYQDIALAIRSLKFNWGESYVDDMLRSYGIEKPDWDKLEFYIMLDEFF
jgi:aminoglycoside phosphotransferase